MKLRIPAKTVLACDLCKRESSLLDDCVVCEKQYCNTCEAIIMGCIHQPELCKDCGGRDEVKKTVLRFSYPLVQVLKRRDNALRRIKIK